VAFSCLQPSAPGIWLILVSRGNFGTTIQEERALIAFFNEKSPTLFQKQNLKSHQKNPYWGRRGGGMRGKDN